jgi:hypothetical protein
MQLGSNVALAATLYEEGHQLLLRNDAVAAIKCFDQAEELGFPADACAGARWPCWMLLGQFERAWSESDSITRLGKEDPHRFWDGQGWQGKHVMLRCLHGLGDTIQFIRYASLLRAACSSLCVQVHPQLVSFLQGAMGIDQVITWGQEGDYIEPAWDMQMEVTELPRAFRSTIHSVPREIPYITVPRERIEWAAQYFPSSHKRRIGVSWIAGAWNPSRSIPLKELVRGLASSEHSFYSLQKGVCASDLGPCPLEELEVYAADVRDTAALILNLDLVITVDTVTAHIAGSLGRPVWILLPFHADWRWMLARNDSPWYPTARLFRQTRPGDWTGVMVQVQEALDCLSHS